MTENLSQLNAPVLMTEPPYVLKFRLRGLCGFVYFFLFAIISFLYVLTLYSFNAILILYQNKQNKRTYVTKIKKSTELKRIYGEKCRLGQKFCSLLPRVIPGSFCIHSFI